MTDIASLLPHAGTAVMIERVVSWDEAGIVTATTRHRAADNPLRRDGRLASVHLAEFGAQAMARISQTLIRQISAIAAYSAISANTNRLIQALGTWM